MNGWCLIIIDFGNIKVIQIMPFESCWIFMHITRSTFRYLNKLSFSVYCLITQAKSPY